MTKKPKLGSGMLFQRHIGIFILSVMEDVDTAGWRWDVQLRSPISGAICDLLSSAGPKHASSLQAQQAAEVTLAEWARLTNDSVAAATHAWHLVEETNDDQ